MGDPWGQQQLLLPRLQQPTKQAQNKRLFQTWDLVSLVLDVHLVQASLGGLVLDRDGAILVVSDVRPGGLA